MFCLTIYCVTFSIVRYYFLQENWYILYDKGFLIGILQKKLTLE
jgi:hypothetical protein